MQYRATFETVTLRDNKLSYTPRSEVFIFNADTDGQARDIASRHGKTLTECMFTPIIENGHRVAESWTEADVTPIY